MVALNRPVTMDECVEAGVRYAHRLPPDATGWIAVAYHWKHVATGKTGESVVYLCGYPSRLTATAWGQERAAVLLNYWNEVGRGEWLYTLAPLS